MRTMTKDEYDQEEHGVLWWIGRGILLTLVIGTFGILLWRLLSARVPKEMSTLTPNDALAAAYQTAEENEKELSVFWNDLDTITRADHCRGYFACPKALFIDDCDQVQLIFRYNNSTIRHLAEDYSLPELPDRTEELYDVTLLIAYDLTPDVESDNESNDPACVKYVRVQPTSHTGMEKSLYNYRRFVFDGVDMSDPAILYVFMDVYYVNDVHYDEGEAYGALPVYDYLQKREPYRLSGADKTALSEWSGE